MNDKVGILYFSLTPKEEARRKKWTQRSKVNLKIASNLYDHTLSVIRTSNIPFSISSEYTQVHNNFKTKITKAIDDFFNSGFDQVIVIGSDCPDLNQDNIDTAYKNLLLGIHSLGLTKDGGSYLFTQSKKQWNSKKFEALPWCTPQLGEELKLLLSQESETVCLNTKTDLDSTNCLNQYVQNSISKLSKLMKQLTSICNNYLYLFLQTLTYSYQASYKRGPPIFACK